MQGSASLGLPALGRHKGFVPDLPGGRAHGHQLLCAARVHADHRIHHLLGHPHLDCHRKALHASKDSGPAQRPNVRCEQGQLPGKVCLASAAVVSV